MNKHHAYVSAVFAFALVGTVLPATVLGAQQDAGRSAATWRWDGAVPAGRWLRVNNVNGRITVGRSSDGNVHVMAEKHARSGGAMTAVHFDVNRSASGVTICALWDDRGTCDERGSHGSSGNSPDAGRKNVEVVFQVQVPNGVRAGVNTVNGDVTLSGVTAEQVANTVNGKVAVDHAGSSVAANTVNGDVTIATAGGPVNAATVNGSITADIGQQSSEPMRFSSVNGTIDITTPASFNAVVALSTMNGSIDSKYPLRYDARHRHGQGTVGGGGPELRVATVNGSVRLR